MATHDRSLMIVATIALAVILVVLLSTKGGSLAASVEDVALLKSPTAKKS